MSGLTGDGLVDPLQHIMWFMIFIGIGLIGLMIWVTYDDSITSYKMPSGVICQSDKTTGGGFGGATHEFYDCSDGKTYVNPETYREVKNG